jgi:geranylgeranylglycerol-phosphate geranylgeranyltransferase
MSSPEALARMARPANALVAGASAWAGALLAGAGLLPSLRVAAAILAAIAFAGAGNLRNDVLDVEVDRVAHPDRPLVRGEATARQANALAVALYLVALTCGALAGAWALAVVALALPIMEGYEQRLKAEGLPGNLAIALLAAAPFLVGALAAGGLDAPALAVAGLAALATLGREILKDVEDREADRAHRRTLPLRVGARRAAAIAAVPLCATVLLSPIPWLRGNVLGWAYVPAVALADLAFLGAAVTGFSTPGRGQRLAKAGMVLALLALVSGRAQQTGGWT